LQWISAKKEGSETYNYPDEPDECPVLIIEHIRKLALLVFGSAIEKPTGKLRGYASPERQSIAIIGKL